MNNPKNGSLYAIIGAICFLMYTAYSLFYDIYYNWFVWEDVVGWIVFIWLAVLLFIKKKTIVFLIPSTFAVLTDISYFDISFYYFIRVLIHVSFFVLLLINVIPSISKKATKILWIIPGGLQFILFFMSLIHMIHFSLYFSDVMYLLSRIVISIGYLFLGLWLNTTMPSYDEINQQNLYNTVDYQTLYQSQTVIGGADKLKTYKELLDVGAISQEEFDAKKEQILRM